MSLRFSLRDSVGCVLVILPYKSKVETFVSNLRSWVDSEFKQFIELSLRTSFTQTDSVPSPFRLT